MPDYIDVRTVSNITGEDRRRIWERINSGDYAGKKRHGAVGKGGESYLVNLADLPSAAQIAYIAISDGWSTAGECDLTGYREKYGEEGISELLTKQRAAKEGIAIRKLNPKDIVQQLTAVADRHGVSLRTLYRWMDGYEQYGLDGIMRSTKRKDAGKAVSICPAALQYAASLYLTETKRTCARVYDMLKAKADALGADACMRCGFCEGTEARESLLRRESEVDFPRCTMEVRQGMRIPECRQTLARILAALPPEQVAYARKGEKNWKDNYMQMGKRDKPDKVNAVWFGDHHQFDCFVLDADGKPVRPWITAWYDAATSCLVGWLLTLNPNTDSIMLAMARAISPTKHDEFWGTPVMIYIDNGKDYRSRAFDMGLNREVDLGYLNTKVADHSLTQALNIGIQHALPYQGWSKDVERFFGTIEDIWLRDVPGWCGGSPDERPQDFHRVLARLLETNSLMITDAPELKSWDEVDAALAKIGAAERAVEAIEAKMQADIDALKEAAAAAAAPHQRAIEETEKQITAYAEEHRAEFGDRKTKQLNFGLVGFRKSTKIKIPTARAKLDEVIRQLRKRGMDDCVKVVDPKVDKEALKKYPEKDIVAVGASLRIDNICWYEVDREKLAD